jgi:hypothetical protein
MGNLTPSHYPEELVAFGAGELTDTLMSKFACPYPSDVHVALEVFGDDSTSKGGALPLTPVARRADDALIDSITAKEIQYA